MTKAQRAFSVQSRVRRPWRRYLDALEPLRPMLYEYCCGLTGNPWDAEDLVQDSLLRVFSMLGKIDSDLDNPRAYLIRTATRLWIDQIRRSELERAYIESKGNEATIYEPNIAKNLEVGEAAAALIETLPPQQRAAVLLKDVFDLSLAESAAILKTTVGAVKSALHRGRSGLQERQHTVRRVAPPTELVEQFVEALSNKDMSTLQGICLRDVTVELVGGNVMESLESSKSFFEHAHMVFPAIGFGSNPWWKTTDFRGERIVLGFRTLYGVEGLNEVHRIVSERDKIATLRCYCFCPDTLRFVASELDLTALDRPYRSPTLGSAAKSLFGSLFAWRRR